MVLYFALIFISGDKFADTVTKYLLENPIILVVVLIFGLMLKAAVKFSVHQGLTVQLPHKKFLAGVGSDFISELTAPSHF
jgi:hypothetical protein